MQSQLSHTYTPSEPHETLSGVLPVNMKPGRHCMAVARGSVGSAGIERPVRSKPRRKKGGTLPAQVINSQPAKTNSPPSTAHTADAGVEPSTKRYPLAQLMAPRPITSVADAVATA